MKIYSKKGYERELMKPVILEWTRDNTSIYSLHTRLKQIDPKIVDVTYEISGTISGQYTYDIRLHYYNQPYESVIVKSWLNEVIF